MMCRLRCVWRCGAGDSWRRFSPCRRAAGSCGACRRRIPMDPTNDHVNSRGGTSSENEQPIRFAGSVLGPQRHVCAFFHSPDEEYRVLLPFIKEGFERGEKAFHIVDPILRQAHLRRLESAGINVAAAEQSGHFELRNWADAYLRDGHFEQDKMLALLQEVLEGGRQQGFP